MRTEQEIRNEAWRVLNNQFKLDEKKMSVGLTKAEEIALTMLSAQVSKFAWILEDWGLQEEEYAKQVNSQKFDNYIIGGNPICGKTTTLIRKSSKENLPIIVSNSEQVIQHLSLSKDMGLEIPQPISAQEIMVKKDMYDGYVLVDEIEQVLESLIDCRIVTASTSLHMHEFESRANEGCKDNIKHRNLYENVNEIAPCCKEIFKNIE